MPSRIKAEVERIEAVAVSLEEEGSQIVKHAIAVLRESISNMKTAIAELTAGPTATEAPAEHESPAPAEVQKTKGPFDAEAQKIMVGEGVSAGSTEAPGSIVPAAETVAPAAEAQAEHQEEKHSDPAHHEV